MKVSIIIPVYNVEGFIRQCLESVVNQTYPNIEVILVDDASPDKSIDIAKEFINIYKCSNVFKIITHEQNRGLSAARNTGIKNSTGDYLYFLDSDDELYDKNAISILTENAAETHADVVIGNYMGIKPNSCYESKYNVKCTLKDSCLISAFVKGDIPIMAWNKLVTRKYFIENNLCFKDGILNEDELFSYQLLFLNPTVSMAGVTTYKYNIRPGSIMTTANIDRLISPIIVYEEILKSYKSIKGNDIIMLKNFDHFAFKRYVSIITSKADENLKKQLYTRLRIAQKTIKGAGLMRYLYNCHLFMPKCLGYIIMKIISQKYAKTRNIV